MNLSYFVVKEPKSMTFLTKLKLTAMLWLNDGWKPTIKFKNGVELDFKNKKITLHNPLEIESTENFKIKTKKHLILESGKNQEESRNGYKYSIWLNSPLNEKGEPIQLIKVLDNNGNNVLIEAVYDENNNLIIPEGYLKIDNISEHNQ